MKFIDLFAGIGGFRLGLEDCYFKCVFSCEINKHARQTYYENFNDLPFGDIRELDALDLPRYDILCAGFPCQSFSISGKRQGFKDVRGSVFFELIKILRRTKPRFFILENVPNLMTMNKGQTFNLIINSLEAETYKIKFKVLNSKNFSVPQDRKRLFIMGFKDDKDWIQFKFPEGTPTKQTVHNVLEYEVDKSLFISEENVKKIEELKKIKKNLSQGMRIYDINRYAVTQTANGGGWGAKTGLYKTEQGVRRLSYRESARLQGFPDDFNFSSSDTEARRQIGNAVTVPVVTALGESLKKICETL